MKKQNEGVIEVKKIKHGDRGGKENKTRKVVKAKKIKRRATEAGMQTRGPRKLTAKERNQSNW